LLVSISSGFSQLVDTTPPPAHLPPLIVECESGTNYNACSVWIWHGSAYGAIWPNGAVAQLTVASGNAQQVQINRLDTAGPLKGLTGVYTGKWDGTSFTGGKLIASLNGGSNS
jgi:hypothetical protein